MSQLNRPKSPTEEAKEEDLAQYGSGPLTLEELEEKYPNRPRNHSKTLPFSELYRSLFNPLNENKKQPAPAGRPIPRSKLGPHGQAKVSPHEQRRHIIERFVSRWRSEVGPDFYPALRLILPDKDRDRGVYGLKENTIGKLLVKLMKIDRNSEDGYALLHWKLPGNTAAARMAGDFAGRCYEVLGKRAMRVDPGDMSVGEVNVWLDRLAGASGEAEQMPVMEEFYRRMNAEEMMWLIRIVLKQMKVGATERTFLDLWHPDGEALFSVSSSLRRVCWELYDPGVRLEGEETGVTLMQCFQPQLAQFQMNASFQRMVEHLQVTEEDPEFWIEEKLDGERMQMHMVEDESVPGGKRFCWWSRKAKDYTYLYGDGFEDDNSALSRHLKGAFAEGVRNCILDGEMITWDPDTDKIVAFGTLKTAALSEQKNPFNQKGPRPLFRVFDIVYLNDQPLTRYTLRDRHRALEKAVVGEPRRMEIHQYEAATSHEAIEPLLRKIVAEASEGLVLKNPRSMYRLNSRNDDWIKVKPEYMSEFGESLDCVVIGGYFGSGHRGGTLSSFLCGLRVSENYIKAGANPEKCLSFFKVGGGFKAEDYAEIRHHTEGKWVDWDASKPPSQYIELGGGERLQYERPDVWIRPKDSIVISAKAAEITPSEQFALGWTLRFPRFRRLRLDRTWDSCLDVDGFDQLRNRVDQELKERKEMNVENRKRKPTKRARRELVIAGADPGVAPTRLDVRKPKTKIFEGMEFCVLSESLKPVKKSKAQLEALIKENGGQISQRPDKSSGMIIVADKKVVKVASLIKEAGGADVVKPKWVFDCLAQIKGLGDDESYLLPFEEAHLFTATEEMRERAAKNSDQFGDSYARDVDVDELAEILKGMPKAEDRDENGFDPNEFLDQLEEHGHAVGGTKGTIWRRCRVHFALGEGVSELRTLRLEHYIRFGGGEVVDDMDDKKITQIVVVAADAKSQRALAADVRSRVSSWRQVPRIVTSKWVEDCWKESTLVDEEPYAPS
ncbi:ATP-dependent DNA ligase [Coniochaeta ligniaria NRRL 30616]|uniref:DNA ligase n=1 Tax=Coniochaeta ligniaria NRRL 30616 TaxID=1408157 RepID=A0A1J7K042_9PEZI|nr:ATP-dependent DNA ligase [Coniochaeta ligniaria NRRL 30616]